MLAAGSDQTDQLERHTHLFYASTDNEKNIKTSDYGKDQWIP